MIVLYVLFLVPFSFLSEKNKEKVIGLIIILFSYTGKNQVALILSIR
jgi:hypothetical protein